MSKRKVTIAVVYEMIVEVEVDEETMAEECRRISNEAGGPLFDSAKAGLPHNADFEWEGTIVLDAETDEELFDFS